MGPAKFFESGMWIIPIIMIGLCFLGFRFFLFRGGQKNMGQNQLRENDSEDTPLEILKKRYAKGEISKEEFEDMKKDL